MSTEPTNDPNAHMTEDQAIREMKRIQGLSAQEKVKQSLSKLVKIFSKQDKGKDDIEQMDEDDPFDESEIDGPSYKSLKEYQKSLIKTKLNKAKSKSKMPEKYKQMKLDYIR